MKLSQKLALCWRILRERPGNLMAHAERELLPENGDEMQALMNQGLRELVLVFSTHGHSGFSAGYAVRSLEKLLMFQPLRPLTGEPEEWGETFDGGYVQNRRRSSVFKGDPERFGGAACDINAVVFREANGCCFTGRGSAQPVTFPYTPKTIYVDVDADGNPLDGWDREGVYPGWAAAMKGEA